MVVARTRPEFRSGTGSGGICTGSGPVPVDLAGTRPVPRFFSCWIKESKTTVENGYILKSENLEMLFFMNYNLRYLNGAGGVFIKIFSKSTF